MSDARLEQLKNVYNCLNEAINKLRDAESNIILLKASASEYVEFQLFRLMDDTIDSVIDMLTKMKIIIEDHKFWMSTKVSQ